MNAAEVLAGHGLSGATKFSHRNGRAYVEYPKCGCGERMHVRSHPQHLLEVLGEAGFTVQETPKEPHESYCGRGVCCLGAGHEGKCEQ